LGANPFSGFRDISYTNKKTQTDGAKNRTFRSSLRAVKKEETTAAKYNDLPYLAAIKILDTG